jgi:uncharacterized coiled-coil protein SlyX
VPITAKALLALLDESAELAKPLSNKKIRSLSSRPASLTVKRGTTSATRFNTRDKTFSAVNQDTDEASSEPSEAICLLTFQCYSQGDVHLDHATPVQVIVTRIKRLVIWLNLDCNNDLAAEILELEKNRSKKFFIKDAKEILATEYFVNRYYNDIHNITIMSPGANLSKGKKDFYKLLAVQAIFNSGFIDQVEADNRLANKTAIDALDLIVEKVGSRPAYRMQTGADSWVVISQGGQGLGTYARDWLFKQHSSLVTVPREWNRILKQIISHYKQTLIEGEYVTDDIMQVALLCRTLAGMSLGVSQDSSQPSQEVRCLATPESQSSIIDKGKRIMNNMLSFLSTDHTRDLMKALILQARLIHIVTRSLGDHKVGNSTSYRKTPSYKEFVEMCAIIMDLDALESLLMLANNFREASFQKEKGRYDFYWEKFKSDILPEVKKYADEARADKAQVEELRANASVDKACIEDLGTNASVYQASIEELRANASVDKACIEDLRTNASVSQASIEELRANASDDKACIEDLRTNASVSQASIEELRANASDDKACIEDLGTNASVYQASIEELRANASVDKVCIEDLRTNTAADKASIEDLRANAAADTSRIEGLEANAAVDKASIEDLRANAAADTSRVEELETNAAADKSRIEELETNAAADKSRIEELETNAAADKSRVEELETNAAADKSRIEELETNAAADKSRIEELETNAATDKSRIEELEANAVSDQARIAKLEARLAEYSEKGEVDQARITELEANAAASQEVIRSLTDAMSELREQFRLLYVQLHEPVSRMPSASSSSQAASVSDSPAPMRDVSVAALIAQRERASSQAARRDEPTAEKSESPNTKRK